MNEVNCAYKGFCARKTGQGCCTCRAANKSCSLRCRCIPSKCKSKVSHVSFQLYFYASTLTIYIFYLTSCFLPKLSVEEAEGGPNEAINPDRAVRFENELKSSAAQIQVL